MRFTAPFFACALACFGAALGVSGCGTTPTLPLPPPVASVGAPSLQGLVRVEGVANEDAYVFVLNDRAGVGAFEQAEGDGSFAIEIAAQAGDSLVIWQELDGITGERSGLTVPAPSP